MPHKLQARRANAGFTLLEVLIALAILAISLGALVKVGADQADTLTALRSRTFAAWVAADQLARKRLEADWPALGEDHGVSPMGQRDWYWSLSVVATDEPDVRRVHVSVYKQAASDHAVVSLSGFIGRY